MAPSMHTKYPDVGKTPKPADARPKISKVIFHSVVAALLFNGYYGLEHDPVIAKWMAGQVSFVSFTVKADGRLEVGFCRITELIRSLPILDDQWVRRSVFSR